MYIKAILKLSTDVFMHPYNNPCTGEKAVCKFCGKLDTEPHEISCVARQFQAMLPGALNEKEVYEELAVATEQAHSSCTYGHRTLCVRNGDCTGKFSRQDSAIAHLNIFTDYVARMKLQQILQETKTPLSGSGSELEPIQYRRGLPVVLNYWYIVNGVTMKAGLDDPNGIMYADDLFPAHVDKTH